MAFTSRRRVAAVAVLAVAGLAAGAAPTSATAAFKLTRVAGTDRYATASAIAGDAFPGTTNTALIARGDEFADALAGAYLGGVQTGGAPVLLTETAAVPAATKSRLTSMNAKAVILLGGTSAISTAVEQDLDASYDVTRLAGVNRYETAAKIAQATNTAGVGTLAGKKTAIVASGEQFPDALAAGPIAYSQRFPIILTRAATLPEESRAALTALGITNVIVAGGTTAVSTGVVNELNALGATTERIAGTNRYETATALADFAITKLTGWSTSTIDLARGDAFADALAGGPAAGRVNRSIVLTTSTALSPATKTWLESKASTLVSGRVFGGTAAVSDTVKAAAEQAGGATAAASEGQVTSADAANDRYTFVPTGGSTASTITYKATDAFTVDGSTADLAGFESSLSAADQIRHTPASGTTAAKHELTNVLPSSITSGTVGNVDIANKQFDFVNAVTGDILRPDITYTTGTTLTVDGSTATLDKFEADINEGDTATVAGPSTGATSVALTNATVSGNANEIEKPSTAVQPTRFKIGELGDTPASGNTQVTTTNDDKYAATGGTQSTDKFVVDGGPSDYATFSSNLSAGDGVTYERVGGVQTFTLTNRAPASLTGQAVGTITAEGDNNVVTGNTNDGGSFTLATADDSVTVTYTSGGVFLVNGAVSSEEVFEQRYSAGDTIVYRAADTPSSTTQRLELTDANLSGQVAPASINTGDSPTPPPTVRPPNSYDVLAANGRTVLATVTYGESGDTFQVNGQTASREEFEAALNAVKAGEKRGDVVVERTTTTGTTGSTTTEVHRLTTTV